GTVALCPRPRAVDAPVEGRFGLRVLGGFLDHERVRVVVVDNEDLETTHPFPFFYCIAASIGLAGQSSIPPAGLNLPGSRRSHRPAMSSLRGQQRGDPDTHRSAAAC